MEKTWQIREAELRKEIAKEISEIDLTDFKEVNSDAFLGAIRTRTVAAIIARGSNDKS